MIIENVEKNLTSETCVRELLIAFDALVTMIRHYRNDVEKRSHQSLDMYN